MQTHHNEIALHAVELRYTRKNSPAFETEALEQFQTRLVMAEDETHKRCDPERRCASDRLPQQLLPQATTSEFFMDIDADLRRAAICTPRQEFFEIKPANHPALRLRDP